MGQTKYEDNVITHKISEIKSTIKGFREIINIYGFKYNKTVIKNLRRRLRSDQKAADDKDEMILSVYKRLLTDYLS